MRNKKLSRSELKHADAVAHSAMNCRKVSSILPNSMQRYATGIRSQSELGFNFHKKSKKNRR